MTCLEAIAQADALAPNALSQDRKLRWLREAEGLLRASILSPGDPGEDKTLAMTQDLQLPPPWDSLYPHYLTMQIHYVHGETARFNQANALYRALWKGFRDHHTRSRKPQGTAIRYF